VSSKIVKAGNNKTKECGQRLDDGKTSFTWAEVENHTQDSDCWIVIKGNVYDVTSFAPSHPGGRAIYALGGRDASDVFTAFHDPRTWGRLKEFKVGTVQEPDAKATDLIKDFRQLRNEFVSEGLFNASMLYYSWKVLSTFLLAYLSWLVLLPQGPVSAILGETSRFLLSAFVLGLFWQQSGWLSHDFCHNQVFKNRTLNGAMGYLTGNVFQGFSVDWWKNKHNTHHAVPNELHEHMAVDPDIDTLPFFAWDVDMLQNLAPAVRSALKYQHFLFAPMLTMARLSWASQSVVYAMFLKDPTVFVIENVGHAIHYSWMFAIPYSSGYSVLGCLWFMTVAQLFSGVLLSFVFVMSHNGMELNKCAKDFATSQLVSTRNITFGHFNDWFSGGLNLQIEHHLFPTMPRHNLRKVAARVEKLCKRHNIAYEYVSWCEGTKRVVARLHEIAQLA